MTSRRRGLLNMDDQGRLSVPPELAAHLNLRPGSQIPFMQDENGLHLACPVDDLARVYVEPANTCNFACLTCVRNSWDEPAGQMHANIFQQLLEGLADLFPRPMVFFGGFGEPLFHPEILSMIAAVKALGARVELITNATLLDEDMADGLVGAGLDRLWVSIDGATPESYADIRLGDALPAVIENLERLRRVRREAGAGAPHLGIAFVAMQRNIHQLPDVIRLGRRLGADRFSISNVLAHTPELRAEALYKRSYYETGQPVSEWSPLLLLPRFEINDLTGPALAEALRGRVSISAAGQDMRLGGQTCPFLEKRSVSVRWDGEISPCLPLLHSHTSYLDNTKRLVRCFSFGNLQQQSLPDVWNSPGYRDLRRRLLDFDFSPCVSCNSCEMAEHNLEDCFGNTAPTCGGCLWAQGFIQCP